MEDPDTAHCAHTKGAVPSGTCLFPLSGDYQHGRCSEGRQVYIYAAEFLCGRDRLGFSLDLELWVTFLNGFICSWRGTEGLSCLFPGTVCNTREGKYAGDRR